MRIFVEQYTTDDKSDWERGPWDDEPDKVVWVDDQTGLDCMAHRNGAGAWCGYVGVPPGHPAYGQDYDDVDADAHGGLTYAGPCQGDLCHVPQPGRPDKVWWLGFDCMHFMDRGPAMEARLRGLHADHPELPPSLHDIHPGWEERYWDLASVVSEVEQLASQIAALN